jgi:predicted nuclease of predicted toxin-antitoxin system
LNLSRRWDTRSTTRVWEGVAGCGDSQIWRSAQSAQRFFLTQDLDFSDMRKFAPGSHQGLLFLRLRLPGRLALSRRLVDVFRHEEVNSWAGCFVLVTDSKIRVHRAKA